MKVGKTVCKMQNNVFPTVFILYEITSALLQSLFKNFLNQLCNTIVII